MNIRRRGIGIDIELSESNFTTIATISDKVWEVRLTYIHIKS